MELVVGFSCYGNLCIPAGDARILMDGGARFCSTVGKRVLKNFEPWKGGTRVAVIFLSRNSSVSPFQG